MTKNEIRRQILKRRLSLSKKSLATKSKIICQKLKKLPKFKKARNILFYFPVQNEVDILPILKQSLKTKIVLLPYIVNKQIKPRRIRSLNDLETGPFQIPQPKKSCPVVEVSTVDLVLVPAIAFDDLKHRIGFGFGYYDKLLKKLNCPKIGLAYDFQIIENMPRAAHDQQVDFVVHN
ncbi:MAG: 5-formyltetrahydrofolate cyclo-ligase [Candidatus Gracilibacteria bacterium]